MHSTVEAGVPAVSRPAPAGPLRCLRCRHGQRPRPEVHRRAAARADGCPRDAALCDRHALTGPRLEAADTPVFTPEPPRRGQCTTGIAVLLHNHPARAATPSGLTRALS